MSFIIDADTLKHCCSKVSPTLMLLQQPKKSYLHFFPSPLEGSATRPSTRESCPQPQTPKLRSPAMLEQYYAQSSPSHHSSLGQQQHLPVL